MKNILNLELISYNFHETNVTATPVAQPAAVTWRDDQNDQIDEGNYGNAKLQVEHKFGTAKGLKKWIIFYEFLFCKYLNNKQINEFQNLN